MKYVVFQLQDAKNLVFQNFWFKIPSILIEIPVFLFEILGILKICDSHIPAKKSMLICETNLANIDPAKAKRSNFWE